MAVTVDSSGTQAATVNTEHTLDDVAGPGTYQLGVDMTNMASGDVVELRIYKMFKTGGTRRVTYFASYQGVQPTDDMGKVSVPISTGLNDSGSIRFTLKQVAGTGRNFDWEVLKFA
jgi:hypothetical protein